MLLVQVMGAPRRRFCRGPEASSPPHGDPPVRGLEAAIPLTTPCGHFALQPTREWARPVGGGTVYPSPSGRGEAVSELLRPPVCAAGAPSRSLPLFLLNWIDGQSYAAPAGDLSGISFPCNYLMLLENHFSLRLLSGVCQRLNRSIIWSDTFECNAKTFEADDRYTAFSSFIS